MRQRLQGLRTAGVRVHGHGAPASDLESLALQLGFHSYARGLGEGGIAIEENDPGGEFLGQLDGSLGGHGTQEPLRLLQQQATAVAGLPIAGDRPTMGQAIQRGNSRADEPMARLIVQVGNQAEPATIAFVGFFIESLGSSAHLWPRFSSSAWFEGARRRRPQAQRLKQLDRQFLRSGDPRGFNAAG